jgi:hypothetical protein
MLCVQDIHNFPHKLKSNLPFPEPDSSFNLGRHKQKWQNVTFQRGDYDLWICGLWFRAMNKTSRRQQNSGPGEVIVQMLFFSEKRLIFVIFPLMRPGNGLCRAVCGERGG